MFPTGPGEDSRTGLREFADRILVIVMRVVELLHLGAALVLAMARLDALLIGAQRVGYLGDRGLVGIGRGAAVAGAGGIRRDQRQLHQDHRRYLRPGGHATPRRGVGRIGSRRALMPPAGPSAAPAGSAPRAAGAGGRWRPAHRRSPSSSG